jgi:SAUR family protein
MGKKRLVPPGHVPVLVGTGKNVERFVVHRKLLNHPYFAVLLELAAQEFGYEHHGILRIPCDTAHFQYVVGLIAKKKRKFRFVAFPLSPLIQVQS